MLYVYKKNSYVDYSAHNFWIFWWFHTWILENDRASSAFDLIVILSVWSKRYEYELGGNDDREEQTAAHILMDCQLTTFIPNKPSHNNDTVSVHFNHFYCMEICDKLRRDLAMLTYLYVDVDEC